MIKQYLDYIDNRMKHVRWFDIAFLKLAMLFFGIWLSVVFPETIWSYSPMTYFIVFILAAIIPVYGFYFRKK